MSADREGPVMRERSRVRVGDMASGSVATPADQPCMPRSSAGADGAAAVGTTARSASIHPRIKGQNL